MKNGSQVHFSPHTLGVIEFKFLCSQDRRGPISVKWVINEKNMCMRLREREIQIFIPLSISILPVLYSLSYRLRSSFVCLIPSVNCFHFRKKKKKKKPVVQGHVRLPCQPGGEASRWPLCTPRLQSGFHFLKMSREERGASRKTWYMPIWDCLSAFRAFFFWYARIF